MTNDQAYVQVATDGTGKKIANVSVTEPQAVDTSGNAQADLTRYQQVTHLADEEGDLISDPNVLLTQLVAEQRRTNQLLELMLGTLS